MVNTRSSTSQENTPNVEFLAQQLFVIASKLNTIDSLATEVATLKAQNGCTQEGETSHRTRNGGKFVWREEEEDIYSPMWLKNPFQRPHTKMKFPRFEGGDPRGWILKAEKYFSYYQTPEEHKVDIAAMYLEGDALDLFSWINRERTLLYWEELVKALQENYGPAEFQNPDEHLCSIQQKGSIQEYCQEFAKFSSRVTNWPDHCLLGVFLNGLKEEIKSDVRIHKPRTVYRAMSLALEFENKLGPICSNGESNWTPTSRSTIQKSVHSSINSHNNINSSLQNLRNNASPNPSTSQPLQMQTWETERRNLMAQGLCYRCHEKFAPGHKCKFAKLSCMELTGGDQLEDVDWVNATTVGDSQETNIAEISFHAILGQSVGSTMKLQGEINHRKVLILVDSGSTHNFVVESVVEKHKVPVEIVPTFGVQIGNGGNGAIIRCNKVCQNLQIQLPGFTITQDYYPSALGGADLVFGINWLVSLNTIQVNWKDMFIIFNWKEKRYKLQGMRSASSMG
ncbi:hypothetical protein KY285_000387 [Solanum tuberosum]|nr:hypothetical protein KY285_000387 [Solanum tuberosum]